MHQKRRPNNNMGGNGQNRHHNNNRPRRFNNNRPQNGGGDDAASVARTRRNATQNREKYQMMARDALAMGDRVLAESHLQYADHYHRVLLELPPEEVRTYHQPQHAGQPGAEGQQPQDGNGFSNGHGSDEAPKAAGDGVHALPSFITQPAHGEMPQEEQ